VQEAVGKRGGVMGNEGAESQTSGGGTASGPVGFSQGAEVLVRELDAKNWEVREAFSYTGKSETFDVPVGMHTDFASVPRVFVWFLPRYGRYTLAAVLHDYLWRCRASKGRMAYVDADGTFRRAMREEGVPFLTRWMMWAAVRWGALQAERERRLAARLVASSALHPDRGALRDPTRHRHLDRPAPLPRV